MSRFLVRGLGEDRSWSDRIGNLAVGGVAFEFPKAPDAEKYQVAFSCPGETKVRHATAELVDFDPLPGTMHREDPFHVRLRFSKIGSKDLRALARSFDQLIPL